MIYLLEDDNNIRNFVTYALNTSGLDCRGFERPSAFWSAVNEKTPDLVLLDIKYTTDEMYRKYVGCGIDAPLAFLDYLNEKKIPVILRQVVIPTLNDNPENMAELSKIAENHPCVVKTELLGFKKICKVKYDKMSLEFPFENFREPSKKEIEEQQSLL